MAGRATPSRTVIDTIKQQNKDRKKNSGMVRQSKSGITSAVGSTVALNIGNRGSTASSTTDAADRQLTNIHDTAIDDHLVPKDNNDVDLGSATYSWRNLFLYKIRIYGNASGLDSTKNEIYLDSSGFASLNVPIGGQFRLKVAGIDNLRFTASLIAPQTDGTIDLGQNPSNRFRHLNLTGNIIAQGSLAVNGSMAGGGINTTSVTTQITSTTSDFYSTITNLGSSSSQTVNINSRIGTNLIPTTNGTKSLGDSTHNWLDIRSVGTAYLETVEIGGDMSLTDLGNTFNLASGYLRFGSSVSSATSGTRTLPAQPAGFFYVKDTSGNLKLLPYYNT